jgi:nitrogen fixation/metabolism regulation signal transduction histidine kinase
MSLRLRGRLLLAFGLTAVPPLLLLAAAATVLVSGSYERSQAQRLASGLDAVRQRVERLRERAAAQVVAATHEDLLTAIPREEGDRDLAAAIALRRDLPAFEIVDARGRVVSSSHWPAGIGLPDGDRTFPGDDALRLENVADGYGVAERLALMPAHPGEWRGAPVAVRGGPFLDGDFLADLGALMGAELALFDAVHGNWIAPARSPLRTWSAPAFADATAAGQVSLAGASHLWAAAPLRDGVPVWLVLATPRTPLPAVAARVLPLTLGLAAAALAAALVFAALLSGRIAEPVRELAEGARRVAAGDLESAVPVATSDEIGDLARAFNAMTDELRTSRDRILQAERVAAWREMARRLAHELKNPIFPIQLSIETLRRAEAAGHDIKPLLGVSTETILEELGALRKIIDEFSEFARLPQPVLEPTDVNDVVAQVLSLYEARAATARVETALAARLPPVAADRTLLGRALGNLVANALEAMPDGGTLRLTTKRRPGAVAVEVEDSGPGLTDEQRAHLFTPYFTTKKDGTGLGLAIVQGIVADHGGRIEVHSTPGQGTTFTLILPTGGS